MTIRNDEGFENRSEGISVSEIPMRFVEHMKEKGLEEIGSDHMKALVGAIERICEHEELRIVGALWVITMRH
jgi:hypothetical protein